MDKILISDCEYIIIIALLITSILFSLEKKSKTNSTLDIKMSNAIKGIACIAILMAHYYTMRLSPLSDSWSLSKLIGRFAANIALVLFMFLSGYGITISEKKDEKRNLLNLENVLKKRILKVYLPLIFVCLVALIIYTLYPFQIPFNDIEEYKLPIEVFLINNFNNENIFSLIKFSLGWIDWFIYCIICFYILFYTAQNTAIILKIHPSIILSIFLLIYYILSYNILGQEHAHYYRITWAFLLGNIVACHNELTKKTISIILLIFFHTILNENIYQQLSFLIAGIFIVLIFRINKNYTIKGNILLLLGNISFFYYLCHIRITYVLMYYTKIDSVLIWTLFNIVIAYVMNKLYHIIFKRNN